MDPVQMTASSRTESLHGARLSFGCFFLPVLRRRGRFERIEQPSRDVGDIVDGGVKGGFVGLGWFGKAADLADKLQRSGPDLVSSGRGCEVEEGSDVSTHVLRGVHFLPRWAQKDLTNRQQMRIFVLYVHYETGTRLSIGGDS